MLNGNGLLADTPRLVRPGMLNGGGLPPKQPAGASSLAPMPRRTDMVMTPEVMAKNVAEARQIAEKAGALLSAPETGPEAIAALKDSSNLVQAVADLARELVKRVEAAAREQGFEISDVAKVLAGGELIGKISDLAAESGIGDLDDDDQTLAFSIASQDYMDEGISKGTINRADLQSSMKESIDSLPQEQKAVAQKTALAINKTADKWKDKDPMMAGPTKGLGQSSNEVA